MKNIFKNRDMYCSFFQFNNCSFVSANDEAKKDLPKRNNTFQKLAYIIIFLIAILFVVFLGIISFKAFESIQNLIDLLKQN